MFEITVNGKVFAYTTLADYAGAMKRMAQFHADADLVSKDGEEKCRHRALAAAYQTQYEQLSSIRIKGHEVHTYITGLANALEAAKSDVRTLTMTVSELQQRNRDLEHMLLNIDRLGDPHAN